MAPVIGPLFLFLFYFFTVGWDCSRACWHQPQIFTHPIVLNMAQNKHILNYLEPTCFAYPVKLHSTSATHKRPHIAAALPFSDPETPDPAEQHDLHSKAPLQYPSPLGFPLALLPFCMVSLHHWHTYICILSALKSLDSLYRSTWLASRLKLEVCFESKCWPSWLLFIKELLAHMSLPQWGLYDHLALLLFPALALTSSWNYLVTYFLV